MFKAYKISVFIAIVCVFTSFLLSKTFRCMTTGQLQALNSLCAVTDSVGKFCTSICSAEIADCFLFHASKELVLGMVEPSGHNYIIKQKLSTAISDQYLESLLEFPPGQSREASFQSLLQGLVEYEMDKNANPSSTFHLMWPWESVDDIFNDSQHLRTLAQILRFAHNDEYKLMQLHQDVGVFPRVLGTCGDVYAVEYVAPMLPSPWLDFLPALGNSCHAATSARQILQYLERLQNAIPGHMHLCDLKWTHFGTAADGSVRFLDLDSAFLDRKLAATQSDTACSANSDCDFYECRGSCDTARGVCRPDVSDNISALCRHLVWPWISVFGSRWRLGLLAHLLEDSEVALLEHCGENKEYDARLIVELLVNVETRTCELN